MNSFFLLRTISLVVVSSSIALAQYGTVANKNYQNMESIPFTRNGALLESGRYYEQLYGWSSSNEYIPIGEKVLFDRDGFFNGGAVVAPILENTVSAWVQVRVWESKFGDSFEEAHQNGGWVANSNPLFIKYTGNSGTPPVPPAPLNGLVFPGRPIILENPKSQTIQARTSITLSVHTASFEPISYQWHMEPSPSPEGIIPGANESTYTTGPIRDNTRFWVTAFNSVGSTASSIANIVPINVRQPLLNIRKSDDNWISILVDGVIDSNYQLQYTDFSSPLGWHKIEDFTQNLQIKNLTLPTPTTGNRFFRVIEITE